MTVDCRSFTKRNVPSDLYKRKDNVATEAVEEVGEETMEEFPMEDGDPDDGGEMQVDEPSKAPGAVWETERVSWEPPAFALPMPPPVAASNLRAAGSGHITVDGETIGVEMPRLPAMKRQPRSCVECYSSGDVERKARAVCCPGRKARKYCKYINK